MILNVTLVIQAINFGITYVIVTRVILYPAAQMLMKEDAVHERIREDIAHLADQQRGYKAFCHKQWRGCVSALSAQKPHGPYIPHHRMLDVHVEDEIQPPDQKELVDQLHDTIVKKVEHD